MYLLKAFLSTFKKVVVFNLYLFRIETVLLFYYHLIVIQIRTSLRTQTWKMVLKRPSLLETVKWHKTEGRIEKNLEFTGVKQMLIQRAMFRLQQQCSFRGLVGLIKRFVTLRFFQYPIQPTLTFGLKHWN